jgi:hypothetical protein
MRNLKPPLSQWARTFLILLLGAAAPAFAQINLGSASSFGVLGASTVTNTGATIVNGNVGVHPGSAITGFPPGVIVGGVQHITDAVALQAQTDTTVAYNALAGSACDVDLTGQDLGGLTLAPGVYCYSASAQLTGTLTLDAQGMANPLFIFKFGASLTTASASSVNIINGGNSCNVFWQVGSSATLGTGSSLLGNVLALTSITLNTGASVSGRLLARNGAVTLDGNSITPCGPLGGCPTISLAPLTLPNAMLGAPYSQTIVASGGQTPYTYSVSAGALPTGLSLNALTGVISGSSTATGSFSFTITATDANNCPGSRPYTIEILPMVMCPTVVLNPAVLPPLLLGQNYSQQFTASGGVAPYVYSVSTGALPNGLQLNSSTGQLSGVPLSQGNFNFSIMATDANGCPGSHSYQLQGALLASIPLPSWSRISAALLLLALLGITVLTQRGRQA